MVIESAIAQQQYQHQVKEKQQPAVSEGSFRDRLVQRMESELGSRSENPRLMPEDSRKEVVYLSGSSPCQRMRMPMPRITFWREGLSQSRETVKPSMVRRLKEVSAQLAPFMSVIPENEQKRIAKIVEDVIEADGDVVAESAGVVIKESYTGKAIIDAFGLANPELTNPTIPVHVYDKDTSVFVREVEITYLSPFDKRRVRKINHYIDSLTEDQRQSYQAELDSLYQTLQQDGITQRLITNPKSVGLIGKKTGFTHIELHELLIKHQDVVGVLTAVNSGDESIAMLSPEQQDALLKKAELFAESGSIERVTPLPEEIIQKAIEIAQNDGADTSVVEALETFLADLEQGLERYQHNIARGGFFTKLSGKGLSSIFAGKKLEHWDLFKKILQSKKLLPGGGMYTKGTYLQAARLGHDSAQELFGFTLEEIVERNGKNINSSPMLEFIKNIGNSRIVFDFAAEPIPRFKHQTCSVRYVPTPLDRELRRVIVETDDDIEKAQDIISSYVDSNGEVIYKDVQIVSIEHWKQEVRYIEQAEKAFKN